MLALGLVLAVVWAGPTPPASAAPALVSFRALGPSLLPRGANAVGPVAAPTTVSLRVTLNPRHPRQLTSLLGNLYRRSSGSYHRWLRRGQFLARFGPSPRTVRSVEMWLHNDGATAVHAKGFAVDATMSAADVGRGLRAPLEAYRGPGGMLGYQPLAAPEIPHDLSAAVQTIIGLNTIAKNRPLLAGPAFARTHAGATPLNACPQAATLSNNYWTFNQEGQAYGINKLLSAGLNGAGKTIALYELGASSPIDVSTYFNCFGLTNPVSVTSVDGGASLSQGGTMEADADIEQAATQAPGATLVSYEAPNTPQSSYDLWNTIVTDDTAQVISTSWGDCEPLAAAAGAFADTTLFEQAAAQGQTVLAASGDSGSEGCFAQDGDTTAQVDYPASDAWVTAVGGTDLLAPGDQTAWNECQNNESIACAQQAGGIGAGGGGLSRYEPRPSYQPNILYWNTPQSCGTYCREIPDISANAGVGMILYDSGAGGWTIAGGTSLAAPYAAGLVADIDTGCTTNEGVWTPALYSLWHSSPANTVVSDITSGNTDLTGSNGGDYPALPGYDAATGLGSPIPTGLTCPEISSVTPHAAPPGSVVTISGLGLEDARIEFGTTPAAVLSSSDTTARVVVPNGNSTEPVTATANQEGTGILTSTFSVQPDQARLAVVIGGPTNQGAYGKEILEHVVVTNGGPAEAPELTTILTVPPGLRMIAADGAIHIGSTWRWHLNLPLQPGHQINYTVRLKVAAPKPRYATLTARTSSSFPNPQPSRAIAHRRVHLLGKRR